MPVTLNRPTIVDKVVDRFDACPWSATAASPRVLSRLPRRGFIARHPLRAGACSDVYSPAERARRDATPWTLVQGVLAPAQFAVFAVSLCLIVGYLETGEGLAAANASVVVKTLFLYAIMVTGSIWEKVVFGKYLFAPAFFWEDVVSMLVIALHTAYLTALALDVLAPAQLMYLALAAYAVYVVNAAQFLVKMRAARLQRPAAALLEAAE